MPAARLRLPARQTERGFQDAVIQFAKLAGWLVHAERPAINRRGKWATAIQGHAGFPDLVLVHPRKCRVVVAELKMRGKRPTVDQERWLGSFALAGVAAYCWTPDSWPEIEFVLAG